MMKCPPGEVDVRISILEDDSFDVVMIPRTGGTRRELVEVSAIPCDVRAYIEFINRMAERNI